MTVEPYYADDRVTLLGGDALAILAALPDASVDALITDPPYSSGGQYKTDRMASTSAKYSSAEVDRNDDFSGDNRDQRSFLMWMNLWLGEARRIVKPGGVLLMFTDWRQLPISTDAVQVGGWIWRGIVPWAKTIARPQVGRFTASCEYVVWGSNGAMPLERGVPALPGFYTGNAPQKREHQTQKPVDVMRELVKICPEGGTVLDPFMGSGTTGVAAVLEGRRFVGVEMVDHYQQVAQRRICEAQGQAVPRGAQEAFDLTGGTP